MVISRNFLKYAPDLIKIARQYNTAIRTGRNCSSRVRKTQKRRVPAEAKNFLVTSNKETFTVCLPSTSIRARKRRVATYRKRSHSATSQVLNLPGWLNLQGNNVKPHARYRSCIGNNAKELLVAMPVISSDLGDKCASSTPLFTYTREQFAAAKCPRSICSDLETNYSPNPRSTLKSSAYYESSDVTTAFKTTHPQKMFYWSSGPVEYTHTSSNSNTGSIAIF